MRKDGVQRGGHSMEGGGDWREEVRDKREGGRKYVKVHQHWQFEERVTALY